MAVKTFTPIGGLLRFTEMGVVLKYYNMNRLQITTNGNFVSFPDGNKYLYNDSELTNTFASVEAFADQIGTWKKEGQASAGGGADTNAVHVNEANEITAITAKTSVVNIDEFILEDSEAGFIKKSITRKNIVKPISNSIATATTLTPNIDENEQEIVTDLATALTIAAPTGTPSTGMKLVIRLTDNGTDRALTWNVIYRAIGITLPSTTTANKILYIGCIYDEAGSKWDAVAVKTEA